MKKIKRILLLLIISLCVMPLAGCSMKNSLKEEIVIEIVQAKLQENLPEKYYYAILEELKISKDSNNIYSKEIAKYILNKSSFSVVKIENNTVSLNIKTKNIYSYLNGNSFLTDYIIKSNDFLKENITSSQYNDKLLDFLKEKINSNDVETKNIKYDIDFNFNEETSTWSISDESYIKLIDVILCRNKEIEEKIEKKLEPLEFLKIEFLTENTVLDPNIDKPIKKEYDKTNEKSYKYNKYLIPEDTEYKDIPLDNETTRTSRRSAIFIGETAVFDGNKLEQNKFNYKINIMIDKVISGDAALDLLVSNKEEIKRTTNYIIFLVNIKLISNDTSQETITFNFTDFDLIDFDNKTYPYLTLKNLKSFDPVKKGEVTSGYIAFEYDGSNLINLAFKEFLPNTLWFEFN